MSKYETGKAAFEKEWKEKRKAAEKKWKEGSTKGKKSTVGGGKQGVRTETPELMKAPKKKAAAPPAKAAPPPAKKAAAPPPAKAAPPPANETRAEKQAKTRARVAWEKQRPDENYREWKARLKGGMPAEKKAAEKKATPPAPAPAKKKGKKAGEGMGYIKEAAKRTKGTKAAPHMVRHTKAPDPSLRRQSSKDKKVTPPTKPRAAISLTEKAGVAQDIGPWKPTDRKATKPKVSYKKPKKTPFGMKKGGSVDTQWGGYDFKDGGRIPGIRPTRKGT